MANCRNSNTYRSNTDKVGLHLLISKVVLQNLELLESFRFSFFTYFWGIHWLDFFGS